MPQHFAHRILAARLAEPDAISICVPTPLSKFKDPDVSYIVAATDAVIWTVSFVICVITNETITKGQKPTLVTSAGALVVVAVRTEYGGSSAQSTAQVVTVVPSVTVIVPPVTDIVPSPLTTAASARVRVPPTKRSVACGNGAMHPSPRPCCRR